ncbi:hypothetical protein D9758_004072 [Tetrapyrgos nigripes]|uniref:Mediator of RNA polymerase II transcription subunit 25 n=1 Tax=Tetrapyrgos nigripes TaxID=182062 RepID=A0A8H5GLB7_9AGAR|nr:hypothetical protein D9758_004072 [Tetrapyrgos nigripes]
MSTADTTLAIALVVDASLALVTSWPAVLQHYVSPLVRRIAETHPNCPYTIGFVTYGSSDSSSSPILCRNFFQESAVVVKAMREDPLKHFALGSTTAGGSKGLATLEGLVAGIEMFDTLLKSRDSKNLRSPVFHLIHLSASVADDSLHPQWNDLSELDETTWEKLPAELSNRDINFSSIVLHSKNARCTELHSSIPATKKVNPWFAVESTHSVLLSGFNITPSSKGSPLVVSLMFSVEHFSAGVKRAGEPATDKPPEKKPRQTPAPSPFLAPSPPAKPVIPPASEAPVLWTNTNVPVANFPPQLQGLFAEYRKHEENVKRIQAEYQAATSARQLDKIANIKTEMQKVMPNFQKYRHFVLQTAARFNQSSGSASQPSSNIPGQQRPPETVMHVNQGSSSQNSPPAGLKPGKSPNSANTDTSQRPLSSQTDGNSSSNPPNATDARNTTQLDPGQNFAASSSSGSNQDPTTQQSRMQMLAPDVAAQMHKLIEQSERSRVQQPFTTGAAAVSNANLAQMQSANQTFPQNAVPDVGPNVVTNANTVIGGPKPPVPASGPQQNPITKGPPVWQGVFFLPADPQTGRRELKVQVAMFTNSQQSVPAARPETWPPLMQLNSTRDPIVIGLDFQVWLKQRQALVCMVQPATGGNEANLANFRLLFEALQSSQRYAVAGWTTPSGASSPNALFFAHNNTTLAAICPITGITELPKQGLALKLAVNDSQRQTIMAAYATKAGGANPALMNANRPGMMPGQQYLGAMPGAPRPGVGPSQVGQPSQPSHPMSHNPAAMNALMGKLGNFGANGAMMANLGLQMNNFQNMMMNNLGRTAGGPSSVGLGGNGLPNISPEMMQSFMQRNAEGNANNGGGQGPGMR